MVQPKPAAVPAPARATAAAASASAPSPTPFPAPAPVVAAPSAATPVAPVAAAGNASAALNADHVRQLTDMGFPEDQATAALGAAQGNPDVAVEFLMTGIPDNIQVPPNYYFSRTTCEK